MVIGKCRGLWQHRINKNTDDYSSGASVKFGTGVNPGYHAKDIPVNSFTNYFVYGDYTFTRFDKAVSWDFNPGEPIRIAIQN